MVFARDAAGDEAAAALRAFHQHRSVAEARRDAVAPDEVELIGFGMRHVFRYQTALLEHGIGRIAMGRWIEVVEAVGQHRHGLHALRQGVAVSLHIDAIGQSADNQYVGAQPVKVADEMADDILAITRAVARAHDVDDVARVEVGRTLVEQRKRCVGAILEPLRIVVVAKAEHLHVVGLVVSQLLLGALSHRIEVAQVVDEAVGQVGKLSAEVIALIHDGCGRPHATVQVHHRIEMVIAQPRQGEYIDEFLIILHRSPKLCRSPHSRRACR